MNHAAGIDQNLDVILDRTRKELAAWMGPQKLVGGGLRDSEKLLCPLNIPAKIK